MSRNKTGTERQRGTLLTITSPAVELVGVSLLEPSFGYQMLLLPPTCRMVVKTSREVNEQLRTPGEHYKQDEFIG